MTTEELQQIVDKMSEETIKVEAPRERIWVVLAFHDKKLIKVGVTNPPDRSPEEFILKHNYSKYEKSNEFAFEVFLKLRPSANTRPSIKTNKYIILTKLTEKYVFKNGELRKLLKNSTIYKIGDYSYVHIDDLKDCTPVPPPPPTPISGFEDGDLVYIIDSDKIERLALFSRAVLGANESGINPLIFLNKLELLEYMRSYNKITERGFVMVECDYPSGIGICYLKVSLRGEISRMNGRSIVKWREGETCVFKNEIEDAYNILLDWYENENYKVHKNEAHKPSLWSRTQVMKNIVDEVVSV